MTNKKVMMWFSSLVLLATITSTSLATQHDLLLDSIWSIQVPEEEAIRFFNDLRKTDNFNNVLYDMDQVRPGEETAVPRSLQKENELNKDSDTEYQVRSPRTSNRRQSNRNGNSRQSNRRQGNNNGNSSHSSRRPGNSNRNSQSSRRPGNSNGNSQSNRRPGNNNRNSQSNRQPGNNNRNSQSNRQPADGFDTALNRISRGLTLGQLTNDLFKGNDFKREKEKNNNGRKEVTGSLRDTSGGLRIPGGNLMFRPVTDKDTILVSVLSTEPTFKKAYIAMEGEAYFTNLATYKIPIKIEKKEDSEDFEITEFALASRELNILEIIDKTADQLQNLFGTDVNTAWINKIQEQLGTFSGFGSFSDESLQLGIQLDENNALTKAMQAKSVVFVIAQSGTDTPRHLSMFVSMEDVINKIGAIVGHADAFKENFLLQNVNSEACLFLVSAQMEYLRPIKSNESLATCFGEQDDENATSVKVFKVVDAGFHISVKIDFEDAIAKGCYGSGDESPPDLENVDTEVHIYGKLTRQGVDVTMLSEVKIPTKMIIHCCKGLLQTAPKALTDGQVTIKEISRFKVEEDDEPKKIKWRLGLKISPAEEYKTIPGTQIAVEDFELDADGYEGDFSSWNIDANLETSIGQQSKINLAIKKSENEYFLELTSSKMILGDILSAFRATATQDTNSRSVLDSLGVKDFSLSMKFGSDVSEYEFLINGKPIIFGFDKLEIAAIIVKENPNAPQDDDSDKKGKVLATKRSGRGRGRGSRGSSSSSSSSRSRTPLQLTIGLYLNGADFTSLMKNVFGREDISLEWLSGLTAAAVFTTNPGEIKLVASSEEEEESSSSDKKYMKVKKGNLKLSQKNAKKDTKRRILSSQVKDEKKSNLTESNITDITYKTLMKRELAGSGDDEEEDSDSDDEDDRRELKFDGLHETLVDKEIDYAITFAVIWDLPSETSKCGGNGLCTWMADNVRDSSMCIMGELGGGVFKLTAAIETKIDLIDNHIHTLTFEGMALELEVGATTPRIELSATMTYSNKDIAATGDNKLVFKGQLSATMGSISLTFTMRSFIFPKFGGESYFAIGDIILGGGLTNGQPNFVFGVALKLGKFDNPPEDTDHAIEIRGAFGIDLGRPRNNWVYGKINALTIAKVCEAFKLDCSLVPESLANSGFPYGIEASYSSEEREIETVGTIREGLYLKGTLNVFGAECSTELSVDTNEFYLHIEMSPLDWGNGLIQVSRSQRDKSNGPFAKVSFSYTDPKKFDYHIEGYANLLGILEGEVRIKVNKTMIDLKIDGYLIPAFLKVHLSLFAGVGANPSGEDALFKLKAGVAVGFSDTLKEALVAFLKNLWELVKKAFDKAKQLIQDAKQKLEDARATVEGWKNTIDSWKNTLEDKKKQLEEDMKPKRCDCPKICFPFLDWNDKCWTLWGHWVGCPYMNSCFKMIDDVFCIAGCAIMNTVTTLVKWAGQAVLTIGQWIAGGIQGLLTLGDGVLALANGVLTAAEEVIELGKIIISGALQLAEKAFVSLVESFKLNKLELSATLTADFSACVGYEYNVTFFKTIYLGTGEACLDIEALTGALIGGITEQDPQTKGASKTRERLQEMETETEEVESAEQDYEKEKALTQSKVTEETTQTLENPDIRNHIPSLHKMSRMLEDVPRHATAPTEKEMEMTKLATQKIPRYNPKFDPKVQQFTAKSPWGLPHNHLPVGRNETAKHDPNQTGEKRTLDFEPHEGACTRMRRAMRGFSDLADGILTYSQAIQNSKKSMQKSRVDDSVKLNRIHDMIDEEALKRNVTMSARDKEDAYYVYNHLADRREELYKKSSIALHTEDSYAMPIIRRQLNGLLQREKGTNFMQFTDLMHSNALEGYKRSSIPNPTTVQGETMLGDIKTELQSIVTSENSALTPMTSRLVNVKRNIIAMSEATKQCRDN